jgi:hypothetical protein
MVVQMGVLKMTVSSSGLGSIFESLQCGGDYSMVFFLKKMGLAHVTKAYKSL